MKARLIRQCERLNPDWSARDAEEAAQAGKPYTVPHSIPGNVGDILEGPSVWRLVRHGYAEPADDECQRMAGMTPAQIQQQKAIVDKLENDQAKEIAKQQRKEAKAAAKGGQ